MDDNVANKPGGAIINRPFAKHRRLGFRALNNSPNVCWIKATCDD